MRRYRCTPQWKPQRSSCPLLHVSSPILPRHPSVSTPGPTWKRATLKCETNWSTVPSSELTLRHPHHHLSKTAPFSADVLCYPESVTPGQWTLASRGGLPSTRLRGPCPS